MMNLVARLLLLSSLLLPYTNGDTQLHHFQADQWDVESPKNPCALTQGFFGRSAKYEHDVKFKYELTLKQGEYLDGAFDAVPAGGTTPDSDGLQGVLNSIEDGIADSLLDSDVFDSACVGGEAKGPYRRGSDRQLLRKGDRQLRAVGISSNPEDQILEGLTCRTFVNETDGPCVVVDGEFVVYLDIYEDLETTLIDFLSNLMNVKHGLDDKHPYIEKVRYVDLKADLIAGNIEEDTGSIPQNGTISALSDGVYFLVAAGAFIVIGTGMVYRRRRNAADHDGETTTLDQRTATQLSQGN